MRLQDLPTLVVLLAVASLPVSSLGDPQPASDSSGDWVLQPAFSDEFDGPILDLSKWNNDVGDWGTWTWEPDNVDVSGGFLYISTQYHGPADCEHDPPIPPTYTSGIIMSTEPSGIRYGYFEARIKAAPLHPGVSPAFWAFRLEWGSSDLTWWTEIDFTELTTCLYQPTCVSISRHVPAHPNLPEPLYESIAADVGFDPRDDFHVYGVQWDEAEIKWYIDGVLQGVGTCPSCTPPGSGIRENEWWHYPMDVTVSMGLTAPIRDDPCAGNPADFPTTFEMDYVRVWKRGRPIPAVSDWYLIVMLLLVITVGTLVYGPRCGPRVAGRKPGSRSQA